MLIIGQSLILRTIRTSGEAGEVLEHMLGDEGEQVEHRKDAV